MPARFLTSAAALAIGAVTMVAAPQTVRAQPVILGDDDRCAKFGWLVGTWTSYSPYQRQVQTGGTLIFSLSGGTAVGRIGQLNSDMEDSGYMQGQTVFRGFDEVYFYGDGGSTRFQSFDGEFLQVDGEASEWRSDTIGVAQNGHLYMTPPAISHLAGGGHFMKSSGAPAGEECGPEPEEAAQLMPTRPTREELLREVLDPQDNLPPVIIKPDPCPPNNPATFLDRREEIAAYASELEAVSGFTNEPGVLALAMMLDNIHDGLVDILDDLIIADRSIDAPEHEAQGNEIFGLLRRIAEIRNSVSPDYSLLNETGNAVAPPARQTSPDECQATREPVLVDLSWVREMLRSIDDPDELEVLSVRQDVQRLVPGLYLGESSDDNVANLRDLLERLGTVRDEPPRVDLGTPDDDEVVRRALERQFHRRYYRLSQEYRAARALLLEPNVSDEQRRIDGERFEKLAGQMLEFHQELSFDESLRRLFPPPLPPRGPNPLLDPLLLELMAARGQPDGPSVEQLSQPRASMEIQTALDRILAEGWSYDSESNQFVPGTRPGD